MKDLEVTDDVELDEEELDGEEEDTDTEDGEGEDGEEGESGKGDKASKAAADKAAADKAARDEAKANRDETSALRARLDQAERLAQYWAEKAKGTGSAPKTAEAEAKLDIDLTEAIASNDAVKIKAAVKQLGFMSSEEVEARVAAATRQARVEADLYGTYPDLKKKDSEMFKRTAAHFSELVSEDPDAKNKPSTMRTAAKLAAAELKAEGNKETDRQDRVRRQSGDSGRPTRRTDDGPEELTPYQRKMLTGLGVSEKDFRAQHKKGVVGGPSLTRGMSRGK